MSVDELIDVQKVLKSSGGVGYSDLEQLSEIVCSDQVSELRSEVESLVEEISEGLASADFIPRAGIALHLLGQHNDAVLQLEKVNDNATASFYHAVSLMALKRYSEADTQLEVAAKLGYDSLECSLRRAETLRLVGKLEDAEAILSTIGKDAAGRAEYSFQMGCIRSDHGDLYGAIESFERAVDMDPRHSRAIFRLAGENASRGNDEDAIRLYEQSLSSPPFYLGAILNLGLLYEDMENYPAAAFCFRRILEADPLNEMAAMYLKDIEAADNMYYDEETARNEARMKQLLDRPVTDFELSVRSRNCLHAMDIHTLGDLTRVSENDLLAGKNFGQTSLDEIREMLTSFGLHIGQNLHEALGQDGGYAALPPELADNPVTEKPISDLGLSVRSRKCMSRLGIGTMGELLRRSPDELLASRNFGVTSLNEIREKLGEMSLKLRND
ncbi:MAG: DNA-directed RNA polymerase subunit alpha C-terminal domain-containing protein [Gimesia sp.]